MTKHINKLVFCLSILLLSVIASCTKIPVGYLYTSDASYVPNVKIAYRTIDTEDMTEEEATLALNKPFASTQIQGLSGTQPITYEFHSVKASDGGDATKFVEATQDGGLLVRGGYIQLFPKATAKLPLGRYTISLKVYNEDHEAILQDIFTFIIKELYEEGDEDTNGF